MSTNQGNPENLTGRPRVAIVIDSPNHMRCVKALHGPNAEPDWYGILRDAEAAGNVVAAIAVVSHGARPALWNRFEDAGYSVRSSNAPDCDELVIAQIVRWCHAADVVVVGGWKVYRRRHSTSANRQASVGLGGRGSVHVELLAAAHDFVDLPVTYGSLAEETATEVGTRAAA